MIFRITSNDIKNITDAVLSDILSDIVAHGHYIDCDIAVRDKLVDIVDKNGSTTQKQLLLKYKGFDISDELKQYLTIVGFSSIGVNQIQLLVQKPARILMENAREWPIYENMIGCFKRDRQFTNLFTLLEKTKCSGNLSFVQAGGKYELIPLFECINTTGDYKDIARYKHCFVFDRDTDDNVSFSKESKSLFQMLCGKEYSEMSNNDVYSLVCSNYIWHMWYRREIENYFPDSQFEALGYYLNIPKNQDSYYIKAENKYVKSTGCKFQKNDLPKLVNGMSKSSYESNLPIFSINGIDINEIQLFLLKLVRII